jgi:hypothetical protein
MKNLKKYSFFYSLLIVMHISFLINEKFGVFSFYFCTFYLFIILFYDFIRGKLSFNFSAASFFLDFPLLSVIVYVFYSSINLVTLSFFTVLYIIKILTIKDILTPPHEV